MSALGDRIRSQAAIADRPGQTNELERIAADVDALEVALDVAINAQLEAAAQAWDEGYEASIDDEPGDSITTPNPYRKESN